MNSPSSLLEATAALARGDLASARPLAQAATRDAPELADAWLMRAVSAMAAGDLDDAGESFARMSVLAPNDARGHAGLGQIAGARGDAHAALTHLHEAALRQPHWSEPSLRIGERLRATRPEQAGGWFLRAALGEPLQPAALSGLLGCALDLRREAPPPREFLLPRPLPRVSIVRSDAGSAHADAVRAAIDRYVKPLLPDVELIEPRTQEASRAAWLNKAIAQAKGEVIVVLRGDVEPCSGEFMRAVLEELMYSDLVGAVGTHWLVAPAVAWTGAPYLQGWPLRRDGGRVAITMHGFDAPVSRGMQALDGTVLALRRELAQRLRFDEGFGGWHLCELEFSHRAYRHGLKLAALAPCAVVQDGQRPADDGFRAEISRFATVHAVPPPFAHRQLPGVTAHVEDGTSALAACAWLERICAQRWRLSWESPPSPFEA